MSLWFALLLGLIQGAAEFLPVSSSGHLALLSSYFPDFVPDTGLLFPVLLHLGTLLPLLVFCRRELAALPGELRGLLRREPGGKAAGLILPLVLGTLPLVPAALLLSGLEGLAARPRFIGAVLLCNGLLLLLGDRLVPGRKALPSAGDALAVGLMQALAALPGLSRSGSTVTAGLLRGLDRQAALRFSFLLSVPAVLGAAILQLLRVLKEGFDPRLLAPCLAGMAAAAVSGWFSLRLTRRLALLGRFGPFGIYCLALGLAALLISPTACCFT